MLIEVKDVSYSYINGTRLQRTALSKINLKIEEGEVVAIVGHTGSGKSTLAQILAGIIKPTQGVTLVDSISVADKKFSETRKNIAMAFQYPEDQLFEDTVYKDIAFVLKKRGLSEEEIHERIDDIIKIVNLDIEDLAKSPFELSGGQKRKVALAGVLVAMPKLLILDEPTAGLDQESRELVLQSILRLSSHPYNMTIILISHDMEYICRVAKRIIVLKKGNIVLDGPPEDVFSFEGEIGEAGLELPKITRLMVFLNENLDSGIKRKIFTIEEARDEIIKFITRQRDENDEKMY